MIPTFSQTRRLQIVTPRKATYKDLAVYHTRDYLETVLQLGRDSTKSLELDVLDNEFGLEDVCYLPFFLPVDNSSRTVLCSQVFQSTFN